MTTRLIQEITPAHASRDGDGVAIQRVAGMQHAALDPILMIDELRSEHREDFAGGFPPHPHRGMQTLTYMKRGGIIHEDNQGNRGEIRGGGAQWMSAGRGIIHSEMPTQDTTGLHGFQLWVNLPAAEKMSPPRYRDVPQAELVEITGCGFTGAVIAGDWQVAGVAATGPLTELAPRASLIDLSLDHGASVLVSADARESVMAYVYAGSLMHADHEVGPRNLVLTASGQGWRLQAGAGGVSLLVLRGHPLSEPVVQYGPFVMNTREEIEQAINDYQSGQFA